MKLRPYGKKTIKKKRESFANTIKARQTERRRQDAKVKKNKARTARRRAARMADAYHMLLQTREAMMNSIIAEEERTEEIRQIETQTGDKYGHYFLAIAHRRNIIAIGSSFSWLKRASEAFEGALAANRGAVKLTYVDTSDAESTTLLLLRRDDEADAVITPAASHPTPNRGPIIEGGGLTIIRSAPWFVEDNFYLFGASAPDEDKPSAEEVFERILLGDTPDGYGQRSVLYNGRLVYVKYLSGFDFIVCRNHMSAERLYYFLLDRVETRQIPNCLFLGEQAEMAGWGMDIEEKTHWSEWMLRKLKVDSTSDILDSPF